MTNTDLFLHALGICVVLSGSALILGLLIVAACHVFGKAIDCIALQGSGYAIFKEFMRHKRELARHQDKEG